MTTLISDSSRPLGAGQRWLVLSVAFLGWMFAGLEISLFPLIHRSAMIELLADHSPKPELPSTVGTAAAEPAADPIDESLILRWFAWYQCAFLFGAAAGGWGFGWLGDRAGRVRAMALSILCYSTLTGVSYFAQSPSQLLVLRFAACLGVGGVWPNAVSLVAEAWPDVARPLLAGLLGSAANFGFVALGLVGYYVAITPDSWRWVLLLGASPAVIGMVAAFCVPESPAWLAGRKALDEGATRNPLGVILRPPLLRRTLIGICLGAIPVLGTSANANWLIPWADKAGGATTAKAASKVHEPPTSTRVANAKPAGDPRLKAWTQVTRSSGAVLGSLLGGWIASLLGRRTTYFLISLVSLAVSSYIYRWLDPTHPQFTAFAFLLGFVGVTYFGWLPLYLPELFPTAVRSTGTGVTFNSGRVLSAIGLLLTAELIRRYNVDYRQIGAGTGLIYAVGMVVILFAPDTSQRKLEE